ncbi:hypothetical protein [Allorhizocola rhizosphaerae]|uniref:hypothetical protein n=1 Tax=Allorhizocola rhizosphaerae TaxID=1872709 RepID=UPI001FEACCA2|nr:hypothetical protein [Allorhizocola rhizosphaerae]
MNAVTRRMRNLATLELWNIPLWAAIWFGLWHFPLTAANVVGFALFALLLVQGAAYWLLKLHQLRSRRPDLPGVGAFRVLRVVNLPIIAGALVVTAHAAVASPGRASWLGLGLAIFGALEHVNYFHVQLMHDTAADLRRLRQVGLRRSHLARDLAVRTASEK